MRSRHTLLHHAARGGGLVKEYIEREKAFDAVFGQFCASSDETEAALNAAIEEIRAIPAADVRPVARGKWTEEMVSGGFAESWESTCSICGKSYRDIGKTNFCPNCGADMKEEN